MALEKLGGFPTFWQESGEGGALMLMLHCSLAHQGVWKGVQEGLGQGLRFRSFDLPGHGRSGDWDGQGDFHDVSTGIAHDLLDEPAHLVGHSFGATVALRLAVEMPHLVRSLTLIEPVYFAALRETSAFPHLMEEVENLATLLASGARDTAAERFSEIWGSGQPWKAQSPEQRRYATERIHLISEGTPGLYEDRAGVLAPGRLEALRLPVLLLDGAASPPAISAIQNVLQTRLPHAQRKTIPEARHMLPITHPGETAREIRRFLLFQNIPGG